MVGAAPPEGHAIACGNKRKTDSLLYVRGKVLDGGLLHRTSWQSIYRVETDDFAAAGAAVKNVFLQAVHRHDSIWSSIFTGELPSSFG